MVGECRIYKDQAATLPEPVFCIVSIFHLWLRTNPDNNDNPDNIDNSDNSDNNDNNGTPGNRRKNWHTDDADATDLHRLLRLAGSPELIIRIHTD